MSTSSHPSKIPSTSHVPTIQCLRLPAFDAGNLQAVRAAFISAKPCMTGQAWLDEPEPQFAPAKVYVGWRENLFLVHAELCDEDIFSSATRLNQRMWELGDTFEMFLQKCDSPGYVELHVTPNNQRLQVRFADANSVQTARRNNSFEELLIQGEAFKSTTWVQPEKRTWFVLAQIPMSLVGGTGKSPAGGRWRFSFSRYDYTRGRPEPVISSTSPHAVADFHRQQEWGILTFC